MSEKRFKKGMNLSCVDTETGKSYWYACNLCGLLNEQQATIEELQQKYDKLCIEMANIYSKYIFMKEFSEDTNPNEAVKYVLRELMQKTKGAR